MLLLEKRREGIRKVKSCKMAFLGSYFRMVRMMTKAESSLITLLLDLSMDDESVRLF